MQEMSGIDSRTKKVVVRYTKYYAVTQGEELTRDNSSSGRWTRK